MQAITKATTADSGEAKVESDNEEYLCKKPIIRAYARRSALLEPKAIEPPDPVVDDVTLQEGPQTQEGEFTDELSDVTETDEQAHSHIKSFSAKLVIKLLSDPRICSLAALNFMLALICLAILIITVTSLIKISNLNKLIVQISNREQPCLYQWSEWGPCSATCLSSSSHLPSRSRHVLNKTIIQARGRFPNCPSNLATMVEHTPCNVYQCPVALSSFTNWTQCFYKDPNIGEAGGCYRMRDLPTTNQLIRIDIDDIVTDCDCPDHIV